MGIPERLKESRAELGLSQAALAEILGATKRSVINWEGGAASPGADVLARYAEAGADVLYILTGQYTPEEPEPLEQLLVDNYRECTQVDKAALIKESTIRAARAKEPEAPKAGKVFTATVTNSVFGRAFNKVSNKK